MDRVTLYSLVILAMVLALPVLSHLLRKYPRFLKYTNWIIFAVYLSANIYLTILSRPVKLYHHLQLRPFWSYEAAFGGDTSLREEVILNIFLYIPLGYLLHYTFPAWKWGRILLTGFLMSVCTESIQLFFKLGLAETDDVISNTLGTVIGIGFYHVYKRIVHSRKASRKGNQSS